MSWPVGRMQVARQLPQHIRIARNRTHWHALRIGQRRQPVVGAKDIGGTIDEVEMLVVGHVAPDSSDDAESLA